MSTPPPADLCATIGRTPLIELRRLSPKPGIRIFAKVEGGNPSGSVKDRVAIALVDALERNRACGPATRSSRPARATPPSPWPPWPASAGCRSRS